MDLEQLTLGQRALLARLVMLTFQEGDPAVVRIPPEQGADLVALEAQGAVLLELEDQHQNRLVWLDDRLVYHLAAYVAGRPIDDLLADLDRTKSPGPDMRERADGQG